MSIHILRYNHTEYSVSRNRLPSCSFIIIQSMNFNDSYDPCDMKHRFVNAERSLDNNISKDNPLSI